MTSCIDSDSAGASAGQTVPLPFESSGAEMAGIRVTRAEFSRLMGCSKQAVTEWVKAGRVTLGADGRLDPRRAVAQLLRTGDPARLRVKVLEPLVQEAAWLRGRVAEVTVALAAAKENAEFHEGAAAELADMLAALRTTLAEEWAWLRTIERDELRRRLEAWQATAFRAGGDPGIGLASLLLDSAASRIAEGEGARGEVLQGKTQ